MAYEPYMIAPSTTGISKYLKPWMQPENALVDMQDCYTYRGVIQKRDGYSLFGNFPDSIGVYNPTGTQADGTTTMFTFTIPNITVGNPIGQYSFTLTSVYPAGTTNTSTDDGSGNLTSGGSTNVTVGTIGYTTGVVTVTFTNAPVLNTPIHMTYGIQFATGNGTQGPYTGTLANTPVALRTVFVSTGTGGSLQTSAPFDNPDPITPTTGDLTNSSPPGVTAGIITYATGVISGLTFTNNVPNSQSIWATYNYTAPADVIKGIKFFWNAQSLRQTIVFNNKQAALLDPTNFRILNITGNDFWNTNQQAFFVVANYQGKSFIVNNSDRLTVYDGINVYQPVINTVNSTPTVNVVTAALGVVLYKNRLVLIRPVETGITQPQRVRYSALNNPFNWASDIQGAGGFIDAPTPEWIVSWGFLHDELIVNFQESTWRLRYTGVDTAPYRWEKINETRLIDASYANVEFNSWITSVGNTGLLKCDGVNTERYDDKIIDFTKDEVIQSLLPICYGYRNDVLNQQYVCYPSNDTTPTNFCDKWLVWNFLENSFAEYNIPSTCFGSYYTGKDYAWQDFNAANELDFSWDDFQGQNWFAYFSQGGAKIPLFGTINGQIMQILSSEGGGLNSDNGTYTGFSFTTKQFNPYVKEGQRAILGYVDFYFDNPNDDALPYDPNYLISIDYFADEQEEPQFTVILNPSQDDWQYKRIFINNNAQFHSFRVYLSEDQINGTNGSPQSSVVQDGLVCNGYILYFKRGGRLVG